MTVLYMLEETYQLHILEMRFPPVRGQIDIKLCFTIFLLIYHVNVKNHEHQMVFRIVTKKIQNYSIAERITKYL